MPLFLFSRGNLVFRESSGGKVHWEWHFPAGDLSRPRAPVNYEDPFGVVRSEEADEQQELRSMAWRMLL